MYHKFIIEDNIIYDVLRALSVLFLLIITISISNNQIYAHTFSTNDSVVFLALVDKLKTQAQLTEQFFLENDYDSTLKHAQILKQLYNNDTNKEIQEKNERIANEISSFIKTFSLIDPNNITKTQIAKTVLDFEAVLDEAISVRISEDILNNSTTQALRLATLVNDVDINYANSFNVQPYNISAMNMDNTSSTHQQPQSMNMSAMNLDKHDQNPTIVSKEIQNDTAYSTALGLSYTISDLFKEIKSEYETNEPDKVNQLSEGITNLVTIIEMKKPYTEVVKVIHGVIQPSLQELYDLKLNIEE
ncbi:MAG TPA: hypothetical protein VFR65_07550 [Nitrososphaeraceae archaeon]|nr:hypothetical protein [Nitrososphaeraceae archaeon]